MTTRTDEDGDTGMVEIGFHYPITNRPFVTGDFDRDSDLDLADFAAFQVCVTGQHAGDPHPCCRVFDFEPDADVDLDDFALFQAVFTGAMP